LARVAQGSAGWPLVDGSRPVSVTGSPERSGHPVIRHWRTDAVAAGGRARIVSLVPSLTELLCDLGLAERLVGCTAYCVHPSALLAGLPRIGGTKTPKIDRILSLSPTHLVVNVDENERTVVERLARDIPHVIVTHPIEVEDHFELFRALGRIFGCEAAARELSGRLAAMLELLNARGRYDPIAVAYYIWKDPWMTVGPDTFIARMLAQVGLFNVPPDDGAGIARYPVCEPARMAAAQPAAVLLSSEPCRFRPADRLQLALALRREAATPVPILGIDGEMCSWYGSRVILGLDYLRRYRTRLEHRLARRRFLRGRT
jgi:ABC-type hemin transport system substrate-binding protein